MAILAEQKNNLFLMSIVFVLSVDCILNIHVIFLDHFSIRALLLREKNQNF